MDLVEDDRERESLQSQRTEERRQEQEQIRVQSRQESLFQSAEGA